MAAPEPTPDAPPVDGRRARRERGRITVVDAMFDLLEETAVPPTVEELAARSGVSVSSIFRYFGSLEDLQHEMLERFAERFAPLFAWTGPDDEPLPARIERFVEARVGCFGATGRIQRVARARSVEHPRLAEGVIRMRALLADQARAAFEPELALAGGPVRRADLLALVDATTSSEAWDVLVVGHGRSPRQIRAAWIRVLSALLTGPAGSNY